jgi:ubiquinone/menaquinone biosynthesis C-methylase UbiE
MFVLSIIRNYSDQIACDIGTDAGYFIKLLERSMRNNYIVDDIDIHKESIMVAHKLIPRADFIVADARKIPIKNSAFQLILCLETLENINHNEIVLQEISCISAAGSLVILSTPNENNLIFKIFKFIYERLLKLDLQHVNKIEKELMLELIRSDYCYIDCKLFLFSDFYIMTKKFLYDIT